MDVDREVAALDTKPPRTFTAARDRLAAELRKAGDARAAEVKALHELRRLISPSLANQRA